MIQPPLLFNYFATFIARDVVFYTITTISTSIILVDTPQNARLTQNEFRTQLMYLYQ